MPKFFVEYEVNINDVITLSGETARHISRSLRMKVGDFITVCDYNKNDCECELVRFTESEVFAKVLSTKPSSEPFYYATLYQALPKGDKMDLIIQKATECGVSAVVPVRMTNCVAKLEKDAQEKKIMRWQRIADEAAMQSRRGKKVIIKAPVSFEKALEMMKNDDMRFALYEGECKYRLGEYLKDKKPTTVSFITGPEGGFSKGETDALIRENIDSVTLGERILRTETAPIFTLSAISTLYELI